MYIYIIDMNFSIYNSYDNTILYNGKSNTLPFTGSYEPIGVNNCIYIYSFLGDGVGPDSLTVEFRNDNDNTLSGTCTKTYNITSGNNGNQISILPELKYFRIKIENNTGNSEQIRKYNTFISLHQILLTDNSGNLKVTSTGGVANSVLINGTNNGNTKPILTDTSGNLNVNVLNTSLPVTISGTQYVSVSGTSTVAFTPTQYDAFGRIRASNPYTLFDSTNVNYQNTKFTQYLNPSNPTNVSGSTNNYTNYDFSGSTVQLVCNVSGTVIREGKYICSYQPGKSLLIMNTFVMNQHQSGLTQRVGYYNDANGVFFEQTTVGGNEILNMVIRTSVSGSMYENRVSQSNWNQNKLDGLNGLNVTKAQILFIDIEWLGVGSVRTGFIINGNYYLAHIFNHANLSPSGNNITAPYMTSARLSPRYEIFTTNAGPNLGYMLKQICSTVISEGGYEARSIVRHIGINGAGINISGQATPSTSFPLVAIKLDDTSSSSAKSINGIIIPSQANIVIFNTNANNVGVLLYQLLLNPTISGYNSSLFTPYNITYSQDKTSTASCWVNLSGVSTANTISGGIIVNSGFITSNNVSILSSPYDFNLQIGRDFSGSSNVYKSDILVLNILPLNIPNNTTLYGQLGWYEI